jgi:hypothetical protein
MIRYDFMTLLVCRVINYRNQERYAMYNICVREDGMLCLVAWYKFTDFSKMITASSIRAKNTRPPDDGGSKHL